MVLADSHRISPVPRYSGYCSVINLFRLQDYHLLWSNFPEVFYYEFKVHIAVLQPQMAVTHLVWAFPRSLATTWGITIVFFSSGYLDVSVPRVCFPITRDSRSSAGRVAPFGNLRIKGYLHLPEAYRSLSRPSSPLRAKASTIRS